MTVMLSYRYQRRVLQVFSPLMSSYKKVFPFRFDFPIATSFFCSFRSRLRMRAAGLVTLWPSSSCFVRICNCIFREWSWRRLLLSLRLAYVLSFGLATSHKSRWPSLLKSGTFFSLKMRSSLRKISSYKLGRCVWEPDFDWLVRFIP